MIFIVVGDGCIDITMAQSIPSIPMPPKAFVKWQHLLWLPTSEQEGTKLLKLVFNQTCQFQLLLRDLAPVIERNSSIFK